MKIVLIHGQNHKGSTYHISRMVAEKMGGEIWEFFLPGDAGEFCCGCFACMEKGREFCPHAGSVGRIFDAVLAADAIVVDSPTYVMEMTGQLKSLFDHLFTAWMPHRPEGAMFSKTAVAVSTAAGTGMGHVTKSIAKQFFYWGVPKTYRIAERVAAMSWGDVSEKRKAQITAKVEKVAQEIARKNGMAKPGLKTKFVFSMMRMMQKGNDWAPLDKAHWEGNGWLGKARPWK